MAAQQTHTLVLLRHAKSDWSGNHPDLERPLASRGRRQAPEAGRWLASNLPDIDLAVVSSAHRARSTWALAVEQMREEPPTRVDDDVYAASATGLLRVVRELPEDAMRVVLVGHNPGLEELVEMLTAVAAPLPTSAIAVVEVSGPWSSVAPSSCVLQASGRPPRSLG